MLQRKDWKDELRKIKNDVTELRNEKEIIRAIQYTEDELKAHIELCADDTTGKILILESLLQVVREIGLGQTGKELSRIIDNMLVTVNDLIEASSDLIAGAEAQAIEFAQEHEQYRKNTVNLLPSVSVSEIDDDLQRRREEWAIVADIQEKYENEMDVLEQQLRNPNLIRSDRINIERKKSGLEKTIRGIIEAVTVNLNEVAILENYRNFIINGLPKDIIGKKLNFHKEKE